MHTSEKFARQISAMEAVASSTRGEQAGEDAITVKEEPKDDIKDYAETTMNELLGLYGYEKVSSLDTEHLNLERYAAGEGSPTSSHGDPDIHTPDPHDTADDTDEISSICSNPNETTLAAQHKNLVSALNSRHSSKHKEEDPSSTEYIVCAWCQNSGLKLFTLKTANGTKAFCSEVCFTHCRRASFKKNKICDWCKHVRHTVNYVDFQDGEVQLQFCCEKCLNQYKMNIFCRETQEHLTQIQAQIQSSPNGSEERSGSGEEGSTNKQILITPDLWLHSAQKRKHSRSQVSVSEKIETTTTTTTKVSDTNARIKTKIKTEPPSISTFEVESSSGDLGRLENSRYDRAERRHKVLDRDRYIRSRAKDFDSYGRRRDNVKERYKRPVSKESPALSSPSNPASSHLSTPKELTNLTSPLLPQGPMYPQWYPPPHMAPVGHMGPYFPMMGPTNPFMMSNMLAPPPGHMQGSRNGGNQSRHASNGPSSPSTSSLAESGQAPRRGSQSVAAGTSTNMDYQSFNGMPYPMLWPPGMPQGPAFCPPGAGPLDGVPGHGTIPMNSAVPPVTVMVPFPVPMPVPIPIPIPIPLTTDQIMTGIRKMNSKNTSSSSSSSSEGNTNRESGGSAGSKDRCETSTAEGQSSKENMLQVRCRSRCDSRASSVSALSMRSGSCSPVGQENYGIKRALSCSPSAYQFEDLKDARSRISRRLLSPPSPSGTVVSCDGAIDLSTDKSGRKSRMARFQDPPHDSQKEGRIQRDSSESRPSSVDDACSSPKKTLPKIHIISAKDEPPLSQDLPLPKTENPYKKRRGLILDAPCILKKPRSPSPERRVYVRNPPRDIYELQARRRCVRSKIKSK